MPTYQELLDQKVPYAIWSEPKELVPWVCASSEPVTS